MGVGALIGSVACATGDNVDGPGTNAQGGNTTTSDGGNGASAGNGNTGGQAAGGQAAGGQAAGGQAVGGQAAGGQAVGGQGGAGGQAVGGQGGAGGQAVGGQGGAGGQAVGGCSVGQTQSVAAIAATDDAFVLEALPQDSNNGAGDELQVMRWSVAASKRSLIQFDITTLPNGASVIASELCLVLSKASGWASTIAVHRLDTPWAELSVSWASPWTNAGGDFNATASDNKSFIALTLGGTVTCWDVTSDVQMHHATPSSNHGWVVKDAAEPALGNGETQFFGSRTHAELSKQPVLNVTYCQ